MKAKLLILLTTIFLFLFATAALAMHHAVKISSKEGIGNYLTDTEGMTLYWFAKDSTGQSSCSGGCLEKWPIFYRETVAPPDGVLADDFATITREDGAKQTTFRGYPLYYFVNDKAAGDTTGEGLKEVWFVVDPDNFPPR